MQKLIQLRSSGTIKEYILLDPTSDFAASYSEDKQNEHAAQGLVSLISMHGNYLQNPHVFEVFDKLHTFGCGLSLSFATNDTIRGKTPGGKSFLAAFLSWWSPS